MKERFFHQSRLRQQLELKLDTSYRQDGFVRAVALLIVDRLLSRHFTDPKVADLLLDELEKHFPDSIPKAAHVSNTETLELMTSTPQKASRTVMELTWVLRQLMVDTMCQAPVQYLPAFFQQGDVITPNTMRNAGAEIDIAGLKALAKILDMTIIVHQTEKNEPLPARYIYGKGKVEYHIDEQDGRFSPRVDHKEAFRPLSSMKMIQHELPVDSAKQESFTKQIVALVNRIQEANKDNAAWLYNMLEDEDTSLSYDDLLQLFIAHAAIMNGQRQFTETVTTLNEILIANAATMISFGITSREELFEAEYDAPTPSSPTMV